SSPVKIAKKGLKIGQTPAGVAINPPPDEPVLNCDLRGSKVNHSGADAVPKCPSLSNLNWQFFLQVPRNVYDHNAISPLEQKHSPKYSRSPIMQKAVVPARLDQLRNQNGDRVLRVFGFELPNIVKDGRDYFTIG